MRISRASSGVREGPRGRGGGEGREAQGTGAALGARLSRSLVCGPLSPPGPGQLPLGGLHHSAGPPQEAVRVSKSEEF